MVTPNLDPDATANAVGDDVDDLGGNTGADRAERTEPEGAVDDERDAREAAHARAPYEKKTEPPAKDSTPAKHATTTKGK